LRSAGGFFICFFRRLFFDNIEEMSKKISVRVEILKASFISGLIFYLPVIMFYLLDKLGVISKAFFCGNIPGLFCLLVLGSIFGFTVLIIFFIAWIIGLLYLIRKLLRLHVRRLSFIVGLGEFTIVIVLFSLFVKGFIAAFFGLYILFLYPMIFIFYYMLFDEILPKVFHY